MHINLNTIKLSFLGNRIVQVKRTVARPFSRQYFWDPHPQVSIPAAPVGQVMVQDIPQLTFQPPELSRVATPNFSSGGKCRLSVCPGRKGNHFDEPLLIFVSSVTSILQMGCKPEALVGAS